MSFFPKKIFAPFFLKKKYNLELFKKFINQNQILSQTVYTNLMQPCNLITGSSRAILQNDTSPSKGNALQACICTLLSIPLSAAPNFIAQPEGYAQSLQAFLLSRGQAFIKVPLSDGKLPFQCSPNTLCVHAAGSPRGNFKHCVVGAVATDGNSIELRHDPHPEGGGVVIREDAWVGFVVSLDPGSNS